MPSTDIDGTPLFILGAKEAVDLLDALEGAQTTLHNHGAYYGALDRALDTKIANIKKFLNDPQVVDWLEANS